MRKAWIKMKGRKIGYKDDKKEKAKKVKDGGKRRTDNQKGEGAKKNYHEQIKNTTKKGR